MEMMPVASSVLRNIKRTRGGNRVLKYRDEECAVTKPSFLLFPVYNVPFSFHLSS